jgi:hypothetical protein
VNLTNSIDYATIDARKDKSSVIDTAKLRGQSVFDTLVHLLGAPVLPYLSAQKGASSYELSFNIK